MSTQSDTLRETRDFLHVLMNMAPATLKQYLADFGEHVIENANAALGIEAFKEGDSVLVQPNEGNAATESFVGIVESKRMDSDADNAKPLFTVVNADGNLYDCEVSELQLEDLA